MPGAGDGAQAHHDLLRDEDDGGERDEQPQQPRSVLLARAREEAEAGGVVVGGHDDEPRPEDRGERREARADPAGGRDGRLAQGAERALDVADVRPVEHRAPPGRRREDRLDDRHQTVTRALTSTSRC